MKKAVVLLFCLTLILAGFTSCRKMGFTVDVFIYDENDANAAILKQSVQDQFDRISDLTAYYHDAENDTDKQLEQIDEAIKRKTSLLVVHLVQIDDGAEALSVINKAKDANLPVVFIERQPDRTSIESYKGSALYIGYSMDSAADIFGDMVGRYILDNFTETDLNRDGKISYAMLRGKLGTTESSKRTILPITKINGMLKDENRSELSFYDDESSLTYLSSEGKRDLAKRFIHDALEAFPFDGDKPIEIILANTDILALGAIEALQEVGYNTGEPDSPSIPVFAIDGTPEGVEAVEKGIMTGTVQWDVRRIAAELAGVIRIMLSKGSMNTYLAPLKKQTEDAEDKESVIRVETDVDMVFLPYERIMPQPDADEAFFFIR